MQQQAKALPLPSGGSPISSMAPFLASTACPHTLASANPLHPPPQAVAEVAAPISSLPPTQNFEDDEEAERGAAPGNRWPRQETVALLKIRSEMDAAFREATFKGPLWEEVARKMAELGYKRSASKCREKFDNVQKYYKRTKESRAGRHDAKTYRFFSQLEALHNSIGGGPTTQTAAAARSTVITFTPFTAAPSATTNIIQPLPLSAMAPSHPAIAVPDAAVSWRNSSSPSQSDENGSEERGLNGEGRQKRKRRSVDGRLMMGFFEGLAKQVMERQEAMHRRFMEAIERREQDRSIREEAWRRQELALRGREQELLAQERATTAARDAALISCLQKMGGAEAAPVPLPTIPAATVASSFTPLPPLPSPKPPISQLLQSHSSPPKQKPEKHGNGSLESPPSSLRWPKAEVHALIKLRSGMEAQYQEAGPKGPLWEEISAGMRLLGYDRSAKRCKEKWENINKYYKKVKEVGKQRVEDGKTCPYYHQLDALYRKKQNGNLPAKATKQIPLEAEGKNGNNCDGGAERVQTSNGDHAAELFEDGTKADSMGAMNDNCDKLDRSETRTRNLNQLDAEEDEEASSNMEYETGIQRQSVNGGGSNDSTSAAAAASTGSCMAMVQ